ncbi:MAG: putative 3-oxoadipate enol-lactone hydrolase [Frankiales bacterium]|nr:putative 3-oxoadipate enol-lactone hydrolase [Frankiales bacterium]
MTAVQVHHVEDGDPDAPAVLMAGSLGSTVDMWEPQVAVLAERFRVVRVDTRGHGRSPVPDGPYALDDLVDDVVDLLDRLGVDRAHVVGLSLGGITAMRLAAREPHRVDRLALLCTSSRFPSPQAWRDRAAAVRAAGTASIAEAVVQRWFTDDLRARAPQVVARWGAVIAATSDEGYASCATLLADMDLTDDLPRITAPTLVVAAAEDPATPPDQLRTIAAAVPGARLEVVDAAAHLVNLERPDVVNALLLEHLGR